MTFKTLIVKNFESEEFDWSNKISDDEIAFIISEADKTVYAWYGQRASIVKKYKGGTLATKIKSLYQFYGFKTATVNQGEETGALKEEIGKLLAGSGTALSEKERDAHKPIAATDGTSHVAPAPRPVPMADVRPRDEPVVDKRPANAPTPVTTTPAGPDPRVAELELELDTEKKKASHKIAKLKDEIDELKTSHEATIGEFEAAHGKELEFLRSQRDQDKGATDAARRELETKLDQARGEKAALEKIIDGLKQDLDNNAKAAPAVAPGEVTRLTAEIDGLKSVNDSLERKNKDLVDNVSSLQAEITALKHQVETSKASQPPPADAGKVAALESKLDIEQKAAAARLADKEATIKHLEDKVSSIKSELEAAKRAAMHAPATAPSGGLDFASLDELDDAGSGPNLSFVNPYEAGSVGTKVDPLLDLKSFLNTVDPSKPLDPVLKQLLEDISHKLEEDDQAIETLETIKKQVKDKGVADLLDDVITKLVEKRA